MRPIERVQHVEENQLIKGNFQNLFPFLFFSFVNMKRFMFPGQGFGRNPKLKFP